MKKQNLYDLTGEYGIGYDCNNKKFYFDLDDYELIKNYCWWINKYGYLQASVNGYEKIYMHRLITNCPKDLIPDHIHGKESRNDNRKSNLRIVTSQENNRNSALSINNTSGVTGVSYAKDRNKWHSYIWVNYKRITLGYFIDFEDAVAARKKAEEEYFGEHSYDNSQNT